jgi:diguanylate cyclase (GGDEF)-like protein
MRRLVGIAWNKLIGLMSGELRRAEFGWLGSPHPHSLLLERRRAGMILTRVRVVAFLFAILTPLWSGIDFLVFPFDVWLDLALMRLAACVGLTCIVMEFKPNGDLRTAYRAVASLFAIPTLFDLISHFVIASHHLAGTSTAIAAGYTFLPFVLLAGLSIFPFTLLENFVIALPILLLQLASGYSRWPTLDWSSFVGALWLMFLIGSISALAGMSQLAYMLALFRQAVRDPLTGAFSRASAEEILELQFNLTRRSNKPLSVAFLDIDHFKSINDRFGHEAGDRALVHFAEMIRENMRRGDVLARWGGEEFLLIMPNTDIPEAESALMRLRQVGFGLRPDNTPLTASIGVAERSGIYVTDWKPLVEKADERMYRAKTGGRDRIVSSDDAGPAWHQAPSLAM